MYWKTLPREEREQWEAKAVIAQAEHRKRYPDWRFRPGANAMAKLKVKDGPGTSKRKGSHSRKGRDDAEFNEKSKEKRCAKIANLLVEGKKGLDLEAAVKEWEGDRTSGKERWVDGKGIAEVNGENNGEEGDTEGTGDGGESEVTDGDLESGVERASLTTEENADLKDREDFQGEAECERAGHEEGNKARSKTPDAVFDSRFRVPLTSMFKRSLSAPASNSRCPYPDVISVSSSMQNHIRRDSVSFPMNTTDFCQSPWLPFGEQPIHEGETRAARRGILTGGNVDSVSSVPTSPSFMEGASTRWSDVSGYMALKDILPSCANPPNFFL